MIASVLRGSGLDYEVAMRGIHSLGMIRTATPPSYLLWSTFHFNPMSCICVSISRTLSQESHTSYA